MMRGTPGVCQRVAVFWLIVGVYSLYPSSAPASPIRSLSSLVIVVDGAGGFEASSKTISQAVHEDHLPIEVRSYRWTHGFCRVASDQMHATHMRREALRLADYILTCREAVPVQPIILLGHSAGCGLVLTAAEQLPPNSLEDIVLLAPAVYAQHDLRPALTSSRRGIEVFISQRDWACLRLGTLLAGTTDRYYTTAAAGRIGFQPVLRCPADAALYAKLRHYPWDPSMQWTGHHGGHYGSYQPAFLRLFVLPLLSPRG
jgi:pimeloyl-ACP methyl ester carboxylesterase